MSNNVNNPQNGLATFAGGCFWCMVAPFEIDREGYADFNILFTNKNNSL